MDIVTLEDFKKERKKRERREKIHKAVGDTIIFADEHKEGLSVIAALVFGGFKIVKSISKHHMTNKKLKEERKHRDLEIYDHSTKQYLKLKRPMTTEEVLEYTSRHKQGEPQAFILYNMGLLK